MTPILAEAAAGSLDISLVNSLIDLCKTCMGLFTSFPLNLFLVGGLVTVGFGIFQNAKHAARS